MIQGRRNFLLGLGSATLTAVAAPAIVRASSLMPIKPLPILACDMWADDKHFFCFVEKMNERVASLFAIPAEKITPRQRVRMEPIRFQGGQIVNVEMPAFDLGHGVPFTSAIWGGSFYLNPDIMPVRPGDIMLRI